METFEELRGAQANLMLVCGIAVGIELAVSPRLRKDESFFGNAIREASECSDEFLQDMMKNLQEYLNGRFEQIRAAKDSNGTDSKMGEGSVGKTSGDSI